MNLGEQIKTHEDAQAWISEDKIGMKLRLFFKAGNINNNKFQIRGIVDGMLVIRYKNSRGHQYLIEDHYWLHAFAKHLTVKGRMT